MSHDLLVYGGGESRGDELAVRWLAAAARAGVILALHPRFTFATHGGYLPLSITLGLQALLGASPGPLRGGFELFFEFFDPPKMKDRDVSLTPDQIVERATFCAIFQISAECGRASCVAAVVAAAALAEAAGGVVVEEDQGRRWTPAEALREAERFLAEILDVERRPTEAAFDGWD